MSTNTDNDGSTAALAARVRGGLVEAMRRVVAAGAVRGDFEYASDGDPRSTVIIARTAAGRALLQEMLLEGTARPFADVAKARTSQHVR